MTDTQDMSAELAMVSSDEAGNQSLAAREQADIQSALIVAKRFPRNEDEAFAKLLKASKRSSFAANARYAFPRGGATVTGPSVNLAREAARMWGNIRYGINVLPSSDDAYHIEAWALDVETNTRTSAQDRFAKKIYRKRGGWQKTEDERDLRELLNRRGALAVRNCLLQLLPRDLIEDALSACAETDRKAAQGDLKKDPTTVRRGLIGAFGEFGVTVEMLETFLGHSMEELNAEEVTNLRGVYKSMRDGNSKRGDHFKLPGESTPDLPEDSEAAKINAELSKEEKPAEDAPMTEEEMAKADAAQDAGQGSFVDDEEPGDPA